MFSRPFALVVASAWLVFGGYQRHSHAEVSASVGISSGGFINSTDDHFYGEFSHFFYLEGRRKQWLRAFGRRRSNIAAALRRFSTKWRVNSISIWGTSSAGRKMSLNTVEDPLQDLGSLLVPGISNDVTLDVIAPKLPWRDGHHLRAVSKDWRLAFQSGTVYDARVRSQATENFCLAFCEFQDTNHLPRKHRIYLHSPTEDCYYKLPCIPGFPSGLPYYAECVPLNGKIYVLGGTRHLWDDSGIREVYELDLAGHESKWKQCACMQVPRFDFWASVMDGKIFVFGGVSGGRRIDRCEKYDPKVDVWSEIQPIIHMDIGRNVAAVGTTPFLLGNNIFLFGCTLVDPTEELQELHDEQHRGELEFLANMVSRDDLSGADGDDPFIRQDDSEGRFHDANWIKMIDPDLFRDDDSGGSPWFHEDIFHKHGFHEIIGDWLHDFNEAIEKEQRWDILTNAEFFLAYDAGKDQWKGVENLTAGDLEALCLLIRPRQIPFLFGWRGEPNTSALVTTKVWPLSLWLGNKTLWKVFSAN